jgi:hypothetical protein
MSRLYHESRDVHGRNGLNTVYNAPTAMRLAVNRDMGR